MCRSQKIIVPHFRPCHCRHPTSSVIDIVVCPQEGLVGVGRINGKVSIMDSTTFTQIRRFNACPNENARLEKLQIHPKSNLMLSACTDKTINILNFTHGLVLATVYGHAKGISGLSFSRNMKFIVSTSRDGCIFIWGIPDNIVRSGVRVVRSALQTVDSKKPLLKAISVVRLPELEFENHTDPMRIMTATRKIMAQTMAVPHSNAESFSEQKADEEEETVSVDEVSSAEVRDLEKAYICIEQRPQSPPFEAQLNVKQSEIKSKRLIGSSRDKSGCEHIEYISV